jgi:hypothetical protein
MTYGRRTARAAHDIANTFDDDWELERLRGDVRVGTTRRATKITK